MSNRSWSRRPGLLVLVLLPLLAAACGTRLTDAQLSEGPAAVTPSAAGPGSTVVSGSTNAGSSSGGPVSSGTIPATSAGGSSTAGATGAASAAGPASAAGSAGSQGAVSGSQGGSTSSGSGAGPAVGASGSGAAVSSGAPCSKELAPVAIGQDGDFSGFLQGSLGGFRPGLAAWAQWVNAQGGVQCHPVSLYQEDDGSDPSRTVSNSQDLIQNKHVVAMVGATVPFNLQPYQSVVDPAGIPTVGGDIIEEGWTQDPLLFPEGTTAIPGMGDAIVANVQHTGKKKLAVMYCVEASECASIHAASPSLAKAAGAQIVSQQAISLTQTDFTANCQNAKNSGADSVLGVFDSSALTRFAHSCASIGYKPTIVTIGLAVGAAAAADSSVQSLTATVADPVIPYLDSFNPEVATFLSAMHTYAPGATVDNSSIEAFASGVMFQDAIAAVAAQARSGPITTAMVLQGLGNLHSYTIHGLAATPLSFQVGKSHAVAPCSFTEVVQPGGAADISHGRPTCTA